jgi:hypothetical protein
MKERRTSAMKAPTNRQNSNDCPSQQICIDMSYYFEPKCSRFGKVCAQESIATLELGAKHGADEYNHIS